MQAELRDPVGGAAVTAEAVAPLPASGGILRDLFLRGASVAAVVPATVAEDVAAVAASAPDRSLWRTIAQLGAVRRSKTESLLAWDTLLAHAIRYLLLGPYGYRIVAVATGLVAIYSAHGVSGFEIVLYLGVLLLVWQLVAIAILLRLRNFSQRLVLPLMLGDLAISVAANLIVAVSAPSVADQTTVELSWKCMMCTSVMWTIGRGLLAGLSIVGFGALLQQAMIYLHDRYVSPNGIPLIANYWDNDLWIMSSVASTALGIAALAIATRLAMSLGIQTGQRAERARILRGVHDTVLQTLETIGLQSNAPGTDDAGASERLDEVGRIASAEAIRIRRSLDQLDRAPAELVDGLAEVVAEAAALGLRVEMAFNLLDESVVSPWQRQALVDATREAIMNVIKHAGVAKAVLSVAEVDGGVQITVRDHGAGFDEPQPGFGTSQSIAGRMVEAGGRATITSKAGSGTRVVLWVPGL
ncbi:MAG: ATP-binding protein [Jatrophihabitantaceae bacterium]